MVMTDRFKIVGTGGAHIDRIGRPASRLHAGLSNPGTMREYAGGGMFNSLRVATFRGCAPCALVSARGADSAGAAIADAVWQSGLHDLSGTFLDRTSGSYTAIHHQDGEVAAALADMAIYEDALPRHLRRKPIQETIANADCVIIDTNMAGNTLQMLCETARSMIVALGISPAKAPRLRPVAHRIDLLFCNRREAMALTETARADETGPALRALFERAEACIMTDGNKPVQIFCGSQTERFTPPTVPMMDATGAGDALAGAMLATRLANPAGPRRDAVLDGIAAACCALTKTGPINSPADLAAFDTWRDAAAKANPKADRP